MLLPVAGSTYIECGVTSSEMASETPWQTCADGSMYFSRMETGTRAARPPGSGMTKRSSFELSAMALPVRMLEPDQGGAYRKFDPPRARLFRTLIDVAAGIWHVGRPPQPGDLERSDVPRSETFNLGLGLVLVDA